MCIRDRTKSESVEFVILDPSIEELDDKITETNKSLTSLEEEVSNKMCIRDSGKTE